MIRFVATIRDFSLRKWNVWFVACVFAERKTNIHEKHCIKPCHKPAIN